MALFSDIGNHCATCNRQDFLPFECSGCHLQFCLQHRLFSQHECKMAGKSSNLIAIICPSCELTFKIYENENADKLMDEHLTRFCKSNETKQKKLAERLATQCIVTKCQESVSTFNCPDCLLYVCVKHRFPDGHKCNPQKSKLNSDNNPQKSKLNSNNNQNLNLENKGIRDSLSCCILM